MPHFLVGIFKSVLYPNHILIIYILSFCSISISKSVCLPVFVSLSSSAASILLSLSILAEDFFKWLPTFQWCVFGQKNYICVLSFDTSLKLPINSVASDFFCLTEQVGHFLCLFFVLGRIFAKINIALLSASVQLAWKTTPPLPPSLITLFVAGRWRLGDTEGTGNRHAQVSEENENSSL